MGIRELQRELYTIATRIREIGATAEAEDRGLTGDEENERQQLIERYDDLQRRIQRMQEDEDRLRALDQVDRRGLPLPSDGGDAGGEGAGGQDDDQRARQYADAFWRYVRSRHGFAELSVDQRAALEGGVSELDGREARALAIGTGAAGGFTVPEGFRNTITETMKWFGPMLDVGTILDTATGNPLPWPTNDDTANVGGILAENTAAGETDLVFGQKQLGAYVYSSDLVRVSFQLLTDEDVDLEPFLGRKLGERIGRGVNAHFTTGTGTAQPQGVVTGSTLGKTGTTGQTTSVIYDDLVDLMHSVDPAYRRAPGVRWMMHDLSVAIVRKLKDGNGLPIWQPAVAAGQPETLLGFPVAINNDMATMAANAKSILFGDFGRYIIRRVREVAVMRLNERYAEALQVGFLGWARFDGLLEDSAAVKHYANSAT